MSDTRETAVQDRHRELGNKIIAHFVEEGHGYQPETVYEIIAQHEAQEIRELRERGRTLETEHDKNCVTILGLRDKVQGLTAERDRLKDGFLFCLGECDGKFWKEHSEEVKSAWEAAQALSAKHDGGGL